MNEKWITIKMRVPNDIGDELEFFDKILDQLLQWKLFYKSIKTGDWTYTKPFSNSWEYVDDNLAATEIDIL